MQLAVVAFGEWAAAWAVGERGQQEPRSEVTGRHSRRLAVLQSGNSILLEAGGDPALLLGLMMEWWMLVSESDMKL